MTKTENNYELKINTSKSLYEKLVAQSQQEGIDLELYINEILAAGVVEKAWDVLEYKYQNKGKSFNNNYNKSSNQNRKNYNNGGSRRGGLSHSKYQDIMENKSSFLEYVRNTDKKLNR